MNTAKITVLNKVNIWDCIINNVNKKHAGTKIYQKGLTVFALLNNFA